MSSPLQVADYATPCPHSIDPDASVADAQRLMRANRIHHLPVIGRKGRLVGTVSHRDLLLLETLRGVDPEAVPVKEAMIPQPYVVQRKTPLDVVARHLWKNRIGSALVVEGDQVVSVFTTTDALRVLVELLQKGAQGSDRRTSKRP